MGFACRLLFTSHNEFVHSRLINQCHFRRFATHTRDQIQDEQLIPLRHILLIAMEVVDVAADAIPIHVKAKALANVDSYKPRPITLRDDPDRIPAEIEFINLIVG